MKKTIVVALTAGLLAGALVGPADAGKKKKPPAAPPAPVKVERVVELEYALTGQGATVAGVGGGRCPMADLTTQECVSVPLEAGEAFIKVEATDATGQKVRGYLSQGDTDGDGFGNLYGDFCGAHPEPIELQSQTAPVGISFYTGANPDCVPSASTTGSLKVTLSNLP